MATCPARNYFSILAYEGKIQEDPAYPLVYGQAVHKGIEERLKNGKDAKKVAAEYVQENLLDKFDAKRLNPETLAKKWDLATKCIDNYEEHFHRRLVEEFEIHDVDPASALEVKLQVPFRQGILSGVIDVITPSGPWLDWKSGSRVVGMDALIRDPQAGIYYYLAKESGLKPPNIFEYIYLTGKNVAMKRDKNGKAMADRSNPKMLYQFKVHQDLDKVNRLFAEYVTPLAKLYEEGVVYKNPTEQNCGGCQYRTACVNTELPAVKDYRDKLVLDIIDMVSDEE